MIAYLTGLILFGICFIALSIKIAYFFFTPDNAFSYLVCYFSGLFLMVIGKLIMK